MSNLQNDKELDKLSQQAAEEYPLDRQPDSWNKLQLRLEAEMPKGKRRRFLLFFLFVLFLGSGLFWLSRINRQDLNETDRLTQTVQQPEEKIQPAKKIAESKDVLPRQQNQSVTNKKDVQKNIQIKIQPGIINKIPSLSGPDQPVEKTSKSKIEKFSFSNQQLSGINRKKMMNRTGFKKTNNNKELAVVTKPDSGIKDEEIQTSDKIETPQPDPVADVQLRKNESAEKIDTPLAGPVIKGSDAKKNKSIAPHGSRWTFAALYAPDLSTVKFTHTQPLGLNLGIEAEYSLSKRFSVQTGLLYTTKNYKLRGQDYHPPKGYWTDYVKLEDVTGTCKMWDIPVNIRYNAMIKKSSRIFVTTGLSSYLMKKESYTYNYYYNGIPTTRSRAYDSGDMYWFSVLNISAGFEKTLSGKFSVQLEPFFKQPLTGVGFGSISLSTAGLYISLRYHPSFTHAKQASSLK